MGHERLGITARIAPSPPSR